MKDVIKEKLYYRKYPLTQQDKIDIIDWSSNGGAIDEDAIRSIIHKRVKNPIPNDNYLKVVIRKEIKFRVDVLNEYWKNLEIEYWEAVKSEADKQLTKLKML